MAENEVGGTDPAEVVLMVCIECGTEYQFEGEETPPPDLTCEKCGNAVFRRFDDAPEPDEVQAEFREETERDLSTDGPATDTEPGDLHDLNNP